jgi:hypothetical protein
LWAIKGDLTAAFLLRIFFLLGLLRTYGGRGIAPEKVPNIRRHFGRIGVVVMENVENRTEIPPRIRKTSLC